MWICRIPASLDYRDRRLRSPRTRGTGDDCLILVLQYRVHESESHAVIAFSRTCNIALDDGGGAAGRPLGVRLEACRARVVHC